MRLSVATASAIALLGFASIAHATTVVNGNFEADPLPAGSHGGTLPTGWSVSSNADIGLYNGFIYKNPPGCCSIVGDPTQLANQFVSFGPGNVDNSGALTQTVHLAAGSYVLDFDEGAFGGGSQSLSASVSGAVNGHPTTDNLANADDNLSSTFVDHQLHFTSTGGDVTLSFAATSGGVGDNIDVILDNVSISAVPEPAAWAMVLFGVGIVGGSLRTARRNSNAALTVA
jgi:hypothetical protein